jgi:hypothetical protein
VITCTRCATQLSSSAAVCSSCCAVLLAATAPVTSANPTGAAPVNPYRVSPDFREAAEAAETTPVVEGPRRTGPLAAGLSGDPQAPSRESSLRATHQLAELPKQRTESTSEPAKADASDAQPRESQEREVESVPSVGPNPFLAAARMIAAREAAIAAAQTA